MSENTDNKEVDGLKRPSTDSMWWCRNCRTWNGTQLPACLKCERRRPALPVTVDNVPVTHADDVTLTHRIRAKLTKLYGGIAQ